MCSSDLVTPKKADQILESLNQSQWKDSKFSDLLKDDEFLSWMSGFVLRVLKDVDSAENRQKVTKNILRNYTLMWLDKNVMPDFVIGYCNEEIVRGMELPKKNITIDRVKILEGTTWATTNSAPKSFDPFANF